jgi:hypothetical protein
MVSKVCVIPVLSSIVSFVAAFIPGWGHMSSSVLRSIETTGQPNAPISVGGACYF